MDADRWARLNEIVPDAVERPPSERTSFFDAVCRDARGRPDEVLRAEVESLLAAHTEADADHALISPFADPGDVALTGADLLVGTRVGPWRLDARLGAGGMGVVYRAHRADELYTREVALKRLRLAHGAEAAHLAHRLQAERRLLAPLEHPGIARLYDGGVDEAGAPYLVMELVDGVPLTAWAARRGLAVPDRIRLLLQVCEAVAYAHRRLIVHRDLKPSNILVAEGADGHPQVKLLDFGIAKLLNDDATGENAVDTGDEAADPIRTQGALTPAYAAPEQLRREPITTATDVYALGVLLHELLTEHRPSDRAQATAAGRLAREAAPPPPSSVAGARALRGDLDAITLKALAQAPDRRYPSADALADDLRRHLDGLPVEARPATAAYRLSRFARRHRRAAAAAAVIALALVGGLGVALWQARVAQAERDAAERRFAVAREAARALLYDVHDAVADLPGATPAREVIVSRSLDYLARLAAEAGGDHALRLDLAAAYLRVGNVLGNPNDHNLGRLDDARASYRRGLALLPGAPPDSLRIPAAHLRGVLLEKLADVTAFAGAPNSALVYMDRALAIYRRNAEAQPERPERHVTLAIGHLKRGDYAGNPNFPNAGRPADALRDYAAMLALLDRADGADGAERLRLRGIAYERLGTIYMAQGDLAAARDAYARSLTIREDLGRRDPTSTNVRRDVGIAHEKLGEVLRAQGRLDEALAAYESAAAVYWALFEADPQNAQARQTLAIGYLHLGDVLGGTTPNLGDAAAAHNHYARALALLEPVAEEDPTNAQIQALMDEARRALGARP